MQRVVTIDGPAGAGKSTVARQVASRLGWRFLDTGAMYRAVTLAAMDSGVAPEDEAAVSGIARSIEVSLRDGRVFLNGDDVSAAIRRREVSNAIGRVADNSEVRETLRGWQRAFAAAGPTVTEGRDQGTIVFPDAMCKLFLTATIDARTCRRLRELGGDPSDTAAFEHLRAEIERRDREDARRAIAPLVPADDAIEVDTTELDCEEVVARILELVARAEEEADAR